MVLTIAIGLVSLLIALNGLLYQPKKDISGPANWSNISNIGKFLFILILVINILNVAKYVYDAENQSLEVQKRNSQIATLESNMKQALEQQEKLTETNRHLIKVMSVADGYNVLVRGLVAFRMGNKISESRVRDSLKNLFLKYAEIEIFAVNNLGKHRGKIDYATHPEIRKFLNLAYPFNNGDQSAFIDMLSRHHIAQILPPIRAKYGLSITRNMRDDDEFKDEPCIRTDARAYNYSRTIQRNEIARSLEQAQGVYYFEIRCSRLKILNDEKIQYARLGTNNCIDAKVKNFEWSREFARLYNIYEVYIDEIEIEELEKLPIMKSLIF